MLIQWPTIATLVMFPILSVVYYRLAMREERDVEARFGEAYRTYRAQVPAFIPTAASWANRRRRSDGGETDSDIENPEPIRSPKDEISV